MLLGPVFSFELLTASRRVRYFAVRGTYAVFLAAALFLVWFSVFHGSYSYYSSTQGNVIALAANFMSGFFWTFSIMQLLAAVTLGPAVAAGTIAVERERRTIEYLFTANLSNAEIVLSKLGARFLQIVFILLAGMPILAVAMLQGGIAPEALAAVYVVTLSTVVVVASLSIAVSVRSAQARDAVTRAYLVLLMLLIVPMVAAGLKMSSTINAAWYDVLMEWLVEPLLTGNPFWMLSSIVYGASGSSMAAGWSAVGELVRNQMVLAFVCAAYAVWAVRRVHVRAMGVSKSRHQLRLLPRLRPGLRNDPMLWKELFAASASSRLGMIGRIAVYLLVACVMGPMIYEFVETLPKSYTTLQSDQINWEVRNYLQATAMIGAGLCCGLGIFAAARAACSITAEKERDCWQSLLGTPLTGTEIVRAKVLGSVYAMRYLFAVLFVIWGMAVVISPDYMLSLPFTLYTLLVIVFSAVSLGVLFSLRMKSSLWSMAATLGVCFVVGGGYMFCCMPFFIVASGPGDDALALTLAPCIPFLLAAPGMFYVEGISTNEGEIIAAYVLGTFGYTITAGVLFTAACSTFDRFAGRTDIETMNPDMLLQNPFGGPGGQTFLSDAK